MEKVMHQIAITFLVIASLTAAALLSAGGIAIRLALAVIWVLIKFIGFMVTEGNPGDNLYGPDPYGRQYGY